MTLAAQRLGAQLPERAAAVVARSVERRRQRLPRWIGARPSTVTCSALLGCGLTTSQEMSKRTTLAEKRAKPATMSRVRTL